MSKPHVVFYCIKSLMGVFCILANLALSLACKSTNRSSDSLPESVSALNERCAMDPLGPWTKEILNNGTWNRNNPIELENFLIAATLAHHSYPYAWQGTSVDETTGGLTPEKTKRYHANFKKLWSPLGAKSIEFIDFLDTKELLEGNAIILGTLSDVFVVFRGVSHFAQFIQSFRHVDSTHTVAGIEMRLWDANILAFKKIQEKTWKAVQKAIIATQNPQEAKLWFIGHSTGGGFANLAALEFITLNPQLKIGGIYTFGSNMVGMNCSDGENCWTSVYNKKLGAHTFRWVNDNDIAPFLPTKQKADQNWSHVPSPKEGIYRISGPRCERVFGSLTQNCIEKLKKPDGTQLAEGCNPILGDHLSGRYLLKIKTCFQDPSLLTDIPKSQTPSCLKKSLGMNMLKTNDL